MVSESVHLTVKHYKYIKDVISFDFCNIEVILDTFPVPFDIELEATDHFDSQHENAMPERTKIPSYNAVTRLKFMIINHCLPTSLVTAVNNPEESLEVLRNAEDRIHFAVLSEGESDLQGNFNEDGVEQYLPQTTGTNDKEIIGEKQGKVPVGIVLPTSWAHYHVFNLVLKTM